MDGAAGAEERGGYERPFGLSAPLPSYRGGPSLLLGGLSFRLGDGDLLRGGGDLDIRLGEGERLLGGDGDLRRDGGDLESDGERRLRGGDLDLEYDLFRLESLSDSSLLLSRPGELRLLSGVLDLDRLRLCLCLLSLSSLSVLLLL